MTKQYRVTTQFETIYTHEKESKIEYTDDRAAALRTFAIYIENPEVRFCAIDIPVFKDDYKIGTIIASYRHE